MRHPPPTVVVYHSHQWPATSAVQAEVTGHLEERLAQAEAQQQEVATLAACVVQAERAVGELRRCVGDEPAPGQPTLRERLAQQEARLLAAGVLFFGGGL